jgi:arabinose-5-phosphate isomerase
MQTVIPATAVAQVREFLTAEAHAILNVAEQLQPDQVEQSLALLVQCQGKVIVIGVGKSGIIAQKIAGTLRSIGIVAVFLHPCDALHGDLGVMTAADVVLALSYSGETEEILDLIPHLRRRQVPIIAMVGNLQSSLARQADVILETAIEREICPLNLAPTTSTTVALALGDALTMTLMHIKGITPEHFAFNHPSGRLGKRLTLTVRDLMYSGREHPTLLMHASWIDVVSTISRGGLGAVNILDADGHLVGLVTDGDLRRWVEKTKPAELETLTAEKIMTNNPVVVSPDTLAYDALKLMENRLSQIAVLPVVNDQQQCVGLIRLHDIVRCGL